MKTDYLLIGTITADIVPDGRILGGTVSYAARVAHAFGLNVTVLTSALPDDPLLDALRQYAEVIVVPAKATTTYENVYAPDGRIQYVRGICDNLTREHVKHYHLNAPLVHLAPLANEVDPQLVHDFPDSRVLITPQGWMRRWDETGRVSFKRWFDKAVLRATDILVFSDEDVLEAPALKQQFIQATENVIVTTGAKGGIYYQSGVAKSFPALDVNIQDPTGAGDVFAAALLSSLPRVNYDIYMACKIAAQIASRSITRLGLDGAPSKEEIQQIFQALNLYFG